MTYLKICVYNLINFLFKIVFITGQTDFYDSSTKGVSLYTRRILVKKEAENVLPKWLRFVKGNISNYFLYYYLN